MWRSLIRPRWPALLLGVAFCLPLAGCGPQATTGGGGTNPAATSAGSTEKKETSPGTGKPPPFDPG